MITRLLPLLLLAASLVGCSAGPARVEATWDEAARALRLTLESEGRNTFTAGGQQCSARPGHPCTLSLPAADLPSGWFDLPVETKRRTGEDTPLSARVFLGDQAFSADCEVLERGGQPVASWEVRCAFPDGFHGVLAGRPMIGGRGTVTAVEVPLPEGEGGVDRPLVRASLPLSVVNRAGASWPHQLPAVVPVPLVQVELSGWQSLWYDDTMPLRVRAEPGAEVVVAGRVLPGADGPTGAVAQVPIHSGENRVEVEATRAGRVPAHHSLLIEGKQPDTPLYLDHPRRRAFRTAATSVRVAGRTLPEAKVYVDTRRVPELIRGAFDVTIPLVEGPNEVQVLAIVDADFGVARRPVTKVTLDILSEPSAPAPAGHRLPSVDPVRLREVLEAAAEDPWSEVGQRVTFPLQVESLARTPVGARCTARLAGLACTEEAVRRVEVGFHTVTASACAGRELPVVVELAACPPGLHEGDRVRVAGVVRGAVGGRWGLRTVERPLVAADDWEPAPWVAPLDAEEP